MAACEHGMPLTLGCDDCTIARLNQQITEDQQLIRQMLEALESCSAVPHWPSFQPAITAARARLAPPPPAA